MADLEDIANFILIITSNLRFTYLISTPYELVRIGQYSAICLITTGLVIEIVRRYPANSKCGLNEFESEPKKLKESVSILMSHKLGFNSKFITSVILQSQSPASLLGNFVNIQVVKTIKLFVAFLVLIPMGLLVAISGQSITKTLAITSTSTNSHPKQDATNLKAMLVVNNNSSGNYYELILHSYSTDEGNYPTGLNFPSKPRILLKTGSYIKVASGNPNFKSNSD